MIMNLFGYEKSVSNSDKLFQSTHLKSSSYKEGTKMVESTLHVASKYLVLKRSLDFNQMKINCIKKTFNPRHLVGDHLLTGS